MKLLFVTVIILFGCPGGYTQDIIPLADIGEIISNSSVLLGDNAKFYCEIIGNQDVGESLTFSKISPVAYVISVDDLVVEDENKYEIRDKYELKIIDAEIEDEGTYECSFAAHDYVGYLTVTDPPATADIYWNEGDSWTPINQAGNLTCYSSTSYPPASFRWYRGSTSLTRDSIRVVDEDNKGYGRAWSYLEMEPTSSDQGDVITCYIDMPHKNAYYTQTIAINFSGASQIGFNVITFVFSTILSLRL